MSAKSTPHTFFAKKVPYFSLMKTPPLARCHSRRKLAASARISRSGCFLNRVFVLKSCSWLKVFSAANGLECIRGQSNPLSNFVLSAKLCPIFALSARLCCFSTAAIERECSCLSAKICRFWRPLIAVSDTVRLLFCSQVHLSLVGYNPCMVELFLFG